MTTVTFQSGIGGVPVNEIELASWDDRFWAWLIDVLLMSILWQRILTAGEISAFRPEGMALLGLLLFVYWTALEGYRGQSLGKMFLNIVVTGPMGESIRFRDAAVQALGKAIFILLPLDCLLGWLYFRKGRQRLFSRLADCIVINRTE
jgi:uncharacterized RDD family membrane protein YckC